MSSSAAFFRRSNMEIMMHHQIMLEDIKTKLKSLPHKMNVTVATGSDEKTERRELMHLQPLRISQLDFKRHDGHYIMVRVVAEPLQMTCIALVVEDQKGDMERLGLYNFARPSLTPAQQFPLGCILAVKNPLYKMAADGFPVIRCDNPENVTFLPTDHTLLAGTSWFKKQTALPAPQEGATDHLRDQGSERYRARDYIAALDLYTRAFDGDEKDHLAASNAAQTALKLEYYHAALFWADKALALQPEHTKSLFRKAQALLGLGKFSDALAIAAHPALTSYEGMDEFMKAVTQGMTESIGIYDMEVISKFVEEHPGESPPIVSDFLSPDVHIVPHPDRGTLVVRAKVALKEGDPVMVTRAVQCARINDAVKDCTFSLDFKAGRTTTHGTSLLQKKILHTMTARGNEPVRAAIRTLLDSTNKPAGANELRSDADVAREVCLRNSFGIPGSKPDKDGGSGGGGTALWIEPSRLMHSCDPNCSWNVMGNVMNVRVQRRVKKGEELTICYTHKIIDQPLRKRREILRDGWGFECNCRKCIREEEAIRK